MKWKFRFWETWLISNYEDTIKEMLMNTVRYLLFLFCMIAFSSCYDDKSTEAKYELYNIEINTSSYIISIGDETELECDIRWDGADSTNFSYSWDYLDEIISTERVLRYVFNTHGSQYVHFSLTDNTTGAVYSRSITITVNQQYQEGWVILSEKNGLSILDFIRRSDFKHTSDVYNLLYPEDPLGSSPVGIKINYSTLNSDPSHIVVLQRGGEGLIELDGRNYRKIIRTEEEFIGGQYPYSGFDPVKTTYSTNIGQELLVTSNGELYSRTKTSTAFQNARYSTIPLVYPDTKGSKISSIVPRKDGGIQPLFDYLNNRWLAMQAEARIETWLPTFKIDYNYDEKEGDDDLPPSLEFYDFCNGMPDDIELVYGETTKSGNIIINVLKDQSNTYYYQRASLSSPEEGVITVSNLYQTTTINPYLDNNSIYHLISTSSASPYLFFTQGNKVYFYYTNNRVYLYKDFSNHANPPTGKIIAMDTYHSTLDDDDTIYMFFAYDSGDFYVCNVELNILSDIRMERVDTSDPEYSKTLELFDTKIDGTIVDVVFKTK